MMGLMFGCGGGAGPGAGSGEPEAATGETGGMHLALNGSIGVSGSLATIAIQNLFDPSQNFLIQCNEKDHTLNGEPFCDELTVLPPGVYEVIVQSPDPNCHPEQPWYKVIVRRNETVELHVNLVCGDANGGLDVIVTETEPPVVRDIDFRFAHTDDQANKFVCRNDPNPLHRYVLATVTVTDSDTPCSEISGTWSSDPNNPLHPLIVGSSVQTHTVDGQEQCLFTAILDSQAPEGDYTLTLTLNDGDFTVPFSFPIHVVTCEFPQN